MRAVANLFRGWGRREVVVAEGQGHCRDTDFVLEQSGLGPMLDQERLEFVDLNHDELVMTANPLRFTTMQSARASRPRYCAGRI